VSLHDVSVEPAIHQHRALHVHLVAYLEQSQVRALQRLLHGRHGVGAVFYLHNGQADAVMSHALVNAQLVDKRAAQRKIDIVSVFLNGYNGSKLLNNSGKHKNLLF